MEKKFVSIAILTFNSSNFIIDALESAFQQSYNSLNLIISDDCSKDETVEIIQNWIEQDRVKKRFLSCQLLTTPKNTGVSANCNRVIKAAKTEWIKFIAGDDILLPNCIVDNMLYIKGHPDAKILFSQIKVYQDTFEPENYIETTPAQFPSNLFHPMVDAEKQFQILCISDRIHFTPSYMFNKVALEMVGFYDESQRLVEDYPMWIKLTSVGIKLHYFHKSTVAYRIHGQATNNTGNNVLFKPSVINSFSIRKKMCHKHLPWEMVASEYQQYISSRLFLMLGLNIKNRYTTLFYKFCCFYFNPFHHVFALKKRLPSTKNIIFYQ